MRRASLPGYRVAAPAAAALIDWPASFGTRFIVGVDTEEEFDWAAPPSRAQRSVAALAALPAQHARFVAAGVPVTYLVDHPVATDPRAADHVRAALALGGGTVGTQLHAWVNPPFDPDWLDESFPGRLPCALEAAKLDALTSAIEAAFGRRPRVYRAGRYGIGPHTFELLAAREYRVDTSVRARYDYASVGGPDFTAVGTRAYRERGIVELPLTTVFTGRLRRQGPRWSALAARVPHGPGVLARSGLLSRVALTPEGMPVREALEAVRIAIGEGERLLNLAFHSPSLVPGHTPYVRDASDLLRFHRWWDEVLDLLARSGVAPASIDEVIAAADAADPLASIERAP